MRFNFYSYLFLLAFLFVGTGHSQQYSLSANLANPRVTLGEVGALELRAIGGEPDVVPRSIDVPGLGITYTGSQFHEDQKLVNGQIQMTLTYTYYYTIQGDRIGDFVIPSVAAKIRGQSVASNSVKVSVVRSKIQDVTPDGNRFARLDIPEKNLYVNQVFPIDATIYVAGRNAINGVTGAVLKHESLVIKRFTQVDLGAIDLKGSVYSTAKLPTTMFALKAGDHRLGPASFDVKLYENGRLSVPSFFTQLRVRAVQSDTARLNILPLPGGAPVSFSGGVGQFEMESKATPRELKIGDPISIDFTITGAGNFETLGAPIARDLDPEVWKTYEAKKQLQSKNDKGLWLDTTGNLVAQRAIFSQVIIPLKDVSEIPAFELSYFDPDNEQYIKRRSIPTPITVAPDNSLLTNSVVEPVATGSAAFPASAAAVPIAQFPDILHIRKGIPKWKPYTAEAKRGILLGLTNTVLGAAFLGLLGLGVLRRIKAHRSQLSVEPKELSYKEALHKVRPGMERDDFYHSALEAFTIWRAENPGAAPDVLALAREMRGKCETALYSKDGDADAKPIPTAEAGEFIKVLRKLPSK